MNKKEITQTIQSIYDWPIPEDKIWEVYNNFTDLLIGDSGVDVIDFFRNIISLDKKSRKIYRNKIATLGFELRPDELDQYILILMIVMTEQIEV